LLVHRNDKTFLLLFSIVLLFVLTSCSNNSELMNREKDDEIEYKLMTSKNDSEMYFTKVYLGLDIDDFFPIETTYNMVFICDGYEGLVNNLVLNLVNIDYAQPITYIAVIKEGETRDDQLSQALPKGSEIILLKETDIAEYTLGRLPVLYSVRNRTVVNKYSNFRVQDWKKIKDFLLLSDYLSTVKIAGLGGSFPELYLKRENGEPLTYNEKGKKILITLSPECSICMDAASWILKQEWPIKPTIVINNNGAYMLEAFQEMDAYYGEFEISEESYESIKTGQLMQKERVTGLLNILNESCAVYTDDYNELGVKLNLYQYPSMIIVNENNEIVSRFFLMLVNSAFSETGDYQDPLLLVEQYFGKQ